jgi:hypothetical protein
MNPFKAHLSRFSHTPKTVLRCKVRSVDTCRKYALTPPLEPGDTHDVATRCGECVGCKLEPVGLGRAGSKVKPGGSKKEQKGKDVPRTRLGMVEQEQLEELDRCDASRT